MNAKNDITCNDLTTVLTDSSNVIMFACLQVLDISFLLEAAQQQGDYNAVMSGY